MVDVVAECSDAAAVAASGCTDDDRDAALEGRHDEDPEGAAIAKLGTELKTGAPSAALFASLEPMQPCPQVDGCCIASISSI